MAYFHCLIGGGSSGGGYTFTVTCDPDFAGTTITCTDGVTTLTQTCPNASPYEVVFEIPNGGDWTISGTISGDVYSTSINIPSSLELHYISTPEGSTVLPTDDIQTWLACANITDKSYTTLAEVLADRETFETLIADSNACDYMARSTSWAGSSAGIVNSSDAMALLGKYDYACNTLLSNATWVEAIAKSDYFEEVLNVKVPTMTSNTAPSGECSANNIGTTSTQAFWSFSGLSTGTNSMTAIQGTSGYIQYMFSSPVVVHKVSLSEFGNAGGYAINAFPKDVEILGSNDGIDFTQLVTDSYTNVTLGKRYTTIFTNNTAYKYYRLKINNNNGASGYTQCGKLLQFYGRASSNVSNTNGIIHTANGDTVYYINGQGQQVSIDASDFDFSSLDEGVYTFGSTTAKNPSDLSQDYTKQFRITKSPYGGTTELYLMPDAVKTLYWWGYESDGIEDLSTANGWSGTFTAPSHNTNDITTTSTGNVYNGVGSKTPLNMTKLMAIVQGLASSGNGGDMMTTIAKNFNYVDYNAIPIGQAFTKELPVSNNNMYFSMYGYNNRNLKISAIWYE